MIPVRLSLKNFLSYRDLSPVLDLASVHIACLSGENGHGKSALLDAMTWALWGQARSGHEDLIHKGRSDMAVELDFLARDQMYRVSRRHSRSGRGGQGHTVLELQIESDGDSEFRPITGNTIRDTQARIVDILHMDHNTFINTAFLRQGDADRFTSARPTERKAILSEVLDLSYYEGLEAKARERASGLDQDIRDADVAISIHSQELESRPGLEARISDAQEALQDLATRRESALKSATEASEFVNSLNARQAELSRLLPAIDTLKGQRGEIDLRRRRHVQEVTRFQGLIDRRQEIEHGHNRLTEAISEQARLVRALAKKSPLDRRMAELTSHISVERERLSGQAHQIRRRIQDELEPKASRIGDVEGAISILEPRRRELSLSNSQAAQASEALERLSRELDGLNQVSDRVNSLDIQQAELQRRLDLEQASLKNTTDNLRRSIDGELRPRADRLPELETERQLLVTERHKVECLAAEIAEKRKGLENVDSELAVLEQESRNLVETMKDTRQKFDLLERGEANCPVCRQPLGQEGQEHLRTEYESLGKDSRQRHTENRDQQAAATERRKRLLDSITGLNSDFDSRRRALESASGRLEAEIEGARRAAAELATHTGQLEKVQVRLDAGDYGLETRQGLEAIAAELRSLSFDPDRRQQVQVEHRNAGQNLASLQSKITAETLALQRETDNLENALREARDAQDQLIPARKELREFEHRLDSESYASDARDQAAELESVIAELGYDTQEHAGADKTVSELASYGELYRSLQDAIEHLPNEQELLSTTEGEMARVTGELEAAQNKRTDIERALTDLPGADAALRLATTELDNVESALENQRVAIGVLDTQAARYDEIESLMIDLEKQKKGQIDERGLYNELVLAFGKNGIQALIIEDAIPQLENDANELLGRLTDNRMSLRLELKEGRRVRGTDALSEELDLSISDELGIRGYETFSGGETFRINFSLRIALSRLLARRSGAPLRILFIDEGFGSQDTAGQERLTEAIQYIQDDFEKIIVITHIDRVKEAFPVRIEVTKTEQGSTFEIV